MLPHPARNQIDQLAAQFACRKIRRINDCAGAVAHRSQQFPFPRDGVFKRGAVLHERVQTARFLITLNNDRCGRLDIVDGILQVHVV